MKTFVSIFLFFLFLSQAFSSWMLDAAYWLNRDYVAQTLCINKAKPELHCNGKCYLSKQVEKENKSDALPSSLGKKDKDGDVFFNLPQELVIADLPGKINSYTVLADNFITSDFTHTILKPPCSFFM